MEHKYRSLSRAGPSIGITVRAADVSLGHDQYLCRPCHGGVAPRTKKVFGVTSNDFSNTHTGEGTTVDTGFAVPMGCLMRFLFPYLGPTTSNNY